ncbi:hypothetical protein T08_8991 [Trichinella sp. T8]|nr:hypothetical protein T08_8991 [Trichinella sp. T8]
MIHVRLVKEYSPLQAGGIAPEDFQKKIVHTYTCEHRRSLYCSHHSFYSKLNRTEWLKLALFILLIFHRQCFMD